MNDQETKQAIEAALRRFPGQPLADVAKKLLAELGYHSKRTLALKPNTPENFVAIFGHGRVLNERYALPSEWKSIDFLFQVADDEIRSSGNLHLNFESKGVFNGAIIDSYLFFAIELKGSHYTRTALAGITREINRLFTMPALILFRHGETLTLAIINRRLHKREEGKDVLEKVTLIRDISCLNTHRAHIEILFDLSLGALYEKYNFANFVELHGAWQKTLDTSALNKRFYQELADWYFWALTQARFPKQAPKDPDGLDSPSLIRLITRVIFCWFLKEKGLLPAALFDPRNVPTLLNDFGPKESTYYKAVLQNLFFATLNQEMGRREFRKDGQHLMAHNLYRYRSMLRHPAEMLKLLAGVPFMNGGLFECLDRSEGTKEAPLYIRIDGFSDRDDNALKVPNELFFGSPRVVDLNAAYGDNKHKAARVEGLIGVLDRYKFTVAENTPIEEEVALDPELLGKVFENLLAAYNPETGATARKRTGSFYTPREIVNYMVDESLIACLSTKLESAIPGVQASEERLRHLFAYNNERHQFTASEADTLVAAIDRLKVLDPACGSGAFPMGVLHKLVFVLGKLDPGNDRWKAAQMAKIDDSLAREQANVAFADNYEDYGRKLYLIENCIYGVDIQPIAAQISKLRVFISLVVDQKIRPGADNLGIRPLPNLETRFVAANTLINIDRPAQQLLRNPDIDAREADLRRVRREHFLARTPSKKRKCREQDALLRTEISEMLRNDGWGAATAHKLASWDPYDQNSSAPFFDSEWMFGLVDGFDVIIGNPPYGADLSDNDKDLLKTRFDHIVERIRNSFLYFMGVSGELVKPLGIVCFILPNEFLFQIYMTKARRFFLDNTRVMFAVNVGEDVFDAIVPTCLISLQSGIRWSGEIPIADLRGCSLAELPDRLRTQSFSRLAAASIRAAPNSIFTFDAKSTLLMNRLATQFVAFETYCDDVANGVSTSCDAIYIVSLEEATSYGLEAEYSKPCIRGGQFNRFYCPAETGDRLLYVTNEFDPKRGRRILEYLSEHKALLIRKSVEKKAGKRDWHVLFRGRYTELFRKPKILIRQTGDSIIAAVDSDVGYYCIDSVNVALIKEEFSSQMWFFVGLLNSRLMKFFYREISQEGGRVLAQVKPQRVRVLPIAQSAPAATAAVTQLVMQIALGKARNPETDTSEIERELDRLVYGLYGLTSDEIRVVETSAEQRGQASTTE